MQNSPSTTTDIAPIRRSREHEWNLPGPIPQKPPAWDYGYVLKGEAIGSTREHLSDLLVERGVSEMRFVWTPETPEPVFPEEVPWLVDAFKRTAVKQARSDFLWGAGFTAFGIVIAVGLQQWDLIYRNIFFVFGAVALVEGAWQYARSRHYSQQDAESDASGARFASWIKNKRLTGYTVLVGACIVIVGTVQVLAGVEESIEMAGLVKPAVWQGQVWRLFTASLMHINFAHFWMNFFALLHFSKIIEQTIHRALVPLIFLLTGAIGSLFSVLLYPHTTSVGASGGLMGLLGFITITTHFDRTRYPSKYFRRLIEAIVFVGVLGLLGFAFIDNAAHLGGLCGGLLLGWVLFRDSGHTVKAKDKLLTSLGFMALLALSAIGATAAYKMLR